MTTLMMLVDTMVFVGAGATALGAIAVSVGPQWQRVLRLAVGQVEQPFAPLAQLAVAERRIAVRRWAATPVPAPIRRLRAAA